MKKPQFKLSDLPDKVYTNFERLNNNLSLFAFATEFLSQGIGLTPGVVNDLFLLIFNIFLFLVVRYNHNLLTIPEAIDVLHTFLTTKFVLKVKFRVLYTVSLVVTDVGRLVFIGVPVDTRLGFGIRSDDSKRIIDGFRPYHLFPLLSFINGIVWLTDSEKFVYVTFFIMIYFLQARFSDFVCVNFIVIKSFFQRGLMSYRFPEENDKKHNRDVYFSLNLINQVWEKLNLKGKEYFQVLKAAFFTLDPNFDLDHSSLFDLLSYSVANKILLEFCQFYGFSVYYTIGSFRKTAYSIARPLGIPESVVSHMCGHYERNTGPQHYSLSDDYSEFIPDYKAYTPLQQRSYSYNLLRFRTEVEYQQIFYNHYKEREDGI